MDKLNIRLTWNIHPYLTSRKSCSVSTGGSIGGEIRTLHFVETRCFKAQGFEMMDWGAIRSNRYQGLRTITGEDKSFFSDFDQSISVKTLRNQDVGSYMRVHCITNSPISTPEKTWYEPVRHDWGSASYTCPLHDRRIMGCNSHRNLWSNRLGRSSQ